MWGGFGLKDFLTFFGKCGMVRLWIIVDCREGIGKKLKYAVERDSCE